MSYCSEADVYAAVGSESIPTKAKLCASVLAAGDVFECDRHGASTDEPVAFRPEAGGWLASPLTEGTTYYVIRVSGSRFQVAATPGGAAIPLTTDGDRVLAIFEAPMAKWIAWASAEVDDMLTGASVPIAEGSVPTIVTAVTARLAAYQARVWSDRDAEDLAALLDDSRRKLERWSKGVRPRGDGATTPANLATAGSAWASYPRTSGSALSRRDDEVIP
jgi:hypothetical protein